MAFKPLNSSMIAGVDYDSSTKELTVTFKNNSSKYTYQNVPQEVANGYLNTSSVGRYHASNVHNKYALAKVSGPPAKKVHPAKPNVHKKYK
jgi:hypothetical protein